MGLVSAPYIAVAALRMLFTEENWEKFKKLKENPECARRLSVESALVYYIDDLLIYTAKDGGYTLHLLVLEFVLNQLSEYGFILNKGKIKNISKGYHFSWN